MEGGRRSDARTVIFFLGNSNDVRRIFYIFVLQRSIELVYDDDDDDDGGGDGLRFCGKKVTDDFVN